MSSSTPVSGHRLSAATAIHSGDRTYQQDQAAFIAHRDVAGCALGVLADGMGGKSGGRKAADQVMLTARQIFERYVPAKDDAAAGLPVASWKRPVAVAKSAFCAASMASAWSDACSWPWRAARCCSSAGWASCWACSRRCRRFRRPLAR